MSRPGRAQYDHLRPAYRLERSERRERESPDSRHAQSQDELRSIIIVVVQRNWTPEQCVVVTCWWVRVVRGTGWIRTHDTKMSPWRTSALLCQNERSSGCNEKSARHTRFGWAVRLQPGHCIRERWAAAPRRQLPTRWTAERPTYWWPLRLSLVPERSTQNGLLAVATKVLTDRDARHLWQTCE
jgi:hypothetical protein